MSDFDNQNEMYENAEYSDASAPVEKESSVFAIISMISGILAILCCCIWYLSVVFGVAAIVLAIISIKRKEPHKGMAVAGIICGAIGLILIVAMFVAGGAFVASVMGEGFDPNMSQEEMTQFFTDYFNNLIK